ncbi:MAG: TIGR02281 family clan AA aspartic protease, partial [Candidatus Competibacterales bacterium]
EETPLTEVLEAVETAAPVDIELRFAPGGDDTVSVDFDALPLAPALRRLLDGYNVALFRRRSGGEEVLRVLVLGRAASRTAPPVVAAPDVETDPALGGDIPAEIDGDLPLPEGLEEGLPEGEPEAKPAQEGAAVELRQGPGGHYSARGRIGNAAVDFLVDTGATAVAVPAGLARRLGLPYGQQRRVETAAGFTVGYATTLDRVQLGALVKNDVAAIIVPQLPGERALLGMSFLGGFELVQRNAVLTIRSVP